MIQAVKLEFKSNTKEELLPGFDSAFPCISTKYSIPEGDAAPWHWHPTVELFYIEKGCLEYVTPSQRQVFHTGFAGILMPNIPHKTYGHQTETGDTQLLHLFEPSLIAGQPRSRIEEKYVLPLTSRTELLMLDPGKASHSLILDLIRESFQLSQEEPGYEILLRDLLSRIWLNLKPENSELRHSPRTSELIRQLMIYIHGHYTGKMTVDALARSVNISERMCYKLFQTHLNMTPMEYVNSCRIRMACQLLSLTEEPITAIASACGFRSGSYFTQIFQSATGQTPRDYRKNRQQEAME